MIPEEGMQPVNGSHKVLQKKGKKCEQYPKKPYSEQLVTSNLTTPLWKKTKGWVLLSSPEKNKN